MALSKQITESIHTLRLQAQQSFHRHMLVLSGSETWCIKLVESILRSEYCEQTLWVSDKPSLMGIPAVHPDKLSSQLGSEYETLIWDGFSGFNPDGLGIASGLLKGGSLFFFLMPALETLQAQADKDYRRMCSNPEDFSACHTFFLQRLAKQIKHSDTLLLIEEDKEPKPIKSLASQLPSKKVKLPTPDQLSAITAIKKVAFGHRHRPLIIKANRGRGKSSAIGLAAAEIYIETQQEMLITAPGKQTCAAAFRHFKKVVECHYTRPEDIQVALKAFKFVALDQITEALPSCHLLFIDEAAAVPISILTELLNHYNRVVFATTIHGYEGNGQGFAIRFHKTLDLVRPQWKSISLSNPIRWAENDPLEAWFFRFLLLDAQLLETKILNHESLRTAWIAQAVLAQNEHLLEQIVSLLVTAHYRTSPSDLRLILDHPRVRILISYNKVQEEVLGVCLIIEEGGLKSKQLAEDIVSGKRRPRGQLFPQALCASSANTAFLEQKCYRVMRIAVHPKFQSKGIGSSLLKSVIEAAKDNEIDSVTSSYGLTPELLSFWHKNKFNSVKLGLKVDGASGLQSLMMMHPVSKRAGQLLKVAVEQFLAAFLFKLSRQHQYLPVATVTAIFQTLSKTELKQKPIITNKIRAFANGFRPYDESDLDVFNYVLSQISTSAWLKLSEDNQAILVMKVLQNRDQAACLKYLNLTGKKQFDSALRRAVSNLLGSSSLSEPSPPLDDRGGNT